MLSLHEMRVDAFERAKDAGANIALVIEHDITRNLEFYSLSLQNVADRLADPEVRRLPDHVQRMVLFDGRIQAQDLGSMLVTDREGRVILDSKVEPARALDFGDRDYFLQQAKSDNLGIYVSKPFEARTGLGLAIALSLRLNDADGRFSGVVSGGLRVRYFDRLFSGVTLGKNGAIALLYADGTLATRRPALTSATAAAKRSEHLALFANTAGGTYLDASVRDGVERLYTYRRIGNYPLFVAVGTATEDIYANWKARAGGSACSWCCSTWSRWRWPTCLPSTWSDGSKNSAGMPSSRPPTPSPAWPTGARWTSAWTRSGAAPRASGSRCPC